MKTFKHRFLSNEITDFNNELDDAIDAWHDTYEGPLTLQAYLGFSDEDYAFFSVSYIKLKEHLKNKGDQNETTPF